jgi:hypothetical protein
LNLAQKQFIQTFSLAVASVMVLAIGWEYFPGTRVWLTILLIVINSPGLLRDIRNSGSRFDPDRFVGLASRKPWILWVMGLYGTATIVFFVMTVTGRLDVSDINSLHQLLMLAPLGIPGTAIYYERLGGRLDTTRRPAATTANGRKQPLGWQTNGLLLTQRGQLHHRFSSYQLSGEKE